MTNQDPKPIKPYNNFVEAYAVQSQSMKKVTYIVAMNDQSEWACSCPAWVWAKPRMDCKHIDQVLKWRATQTNLTAIEKDKPVNRFSAVEV